MPIIYFNPLARLQSEGPTQFQEWMEDVNLAQWSGIILHVVFVTKGKMGKPSLNNGGLKINPEIIFSYCPCYR